MAHAMLRRRNFLAATAASAAALGLGGRSRPARAGAGDPSDRKLLFVVCASGGANIIDGFLPVVDAEVGDATLASSLDVYGEGEVFAPKGSQIRCVRPLSSYQPFANHYDMPTFLSSHFADAVVVTQECTSVNHIVAQKRSMTGAGVDGGRTIAEAAAMRHGEGLLLANCNMAAGGYVEPGDDASVPAWARSEVIVDPRLFAAAMDGARGILGAPAAGLRARGRDARERLDDASPFGRTFAGSELRAAFLQARRERVPELERADLITKLMLLPPEQLPSAYGLSPSPRRETIAAAFPELMQDDWQAQAALAYLLTSYGATCAVTIGLESEPTFLGNDIISTPLAFDFSHNDHRTAQNLMWSRVARVLDGLIGALKATPYLDDPALGTMWDRSLVYVATDFGREKTRPLGAPRWGTGHHLNNGTLLLSPLLRGNRVYGGIDPKTCLTYGFDPTTGAPDPKRLTREGDIYSIIAQALDIDFPGRREVSAVVRG